MKKQTWDYSHLKQDGRNILFFLDTSHVNPNIQERIFKEVSKHLDERKFDTVFIEGAEGPVSLDFTDLGSERDLIRATLQNEGRTPSAYELLAYRLDSRIKEGSLLLYGAESDLLLEEQTVLLSLAGKVADRLDSGKARASDSAMFRRLYKQARAYDALRSFDVVKNIHEQMNSRGIVSAGLIFGKAHYKEITRGLDYLGIGYSSFFPGNPRDSEKAMLDYSLRF